MAKVLSYKQDIRPEITIERGIPMPRSGRSLKYPFGQMEIGDSFAIKVEDRQKIFSAACVYGKRNKKKFAIRRMDGPEVEVRCWRIK